MNKLITGIKYLVFTVFVLPLTLYCYSENNNLSAEIVQKSNVSTLEFIASSSIKSVKLHRLGWALSESAIQLRSEDKLVLSFDDISDSPKSYSYSIIHCDSDWNRSNLFINDFLDGFEVNEIRDFNNSMGTASNYMHCRLVIPNNDIRIKLSGNYILQVFSTYNPSEILVQRRFIVYESILDILAKVRQPSAGEHRYSGQQVDMQIKIAGIRVNDPLNELKTVVCQNYLFQGCKENIKPLFVRGNELDYSNSDALIFDGVNEFRLFDLQNIRYVSQGVQAVNYHAGAFNAQLTPDQSRRRLRYTSYPDLNGRFVVSLDRSTQSDIEADYVWTYFTLNVPMELDEGVSVYLFGELTGWQLSPDNKLNYSVERNAYELRAFLKQGVYNYRYVVVNDKTGEVDVSHFEGSHFDTENTYMVLVYYKPLGSRYDRIVGYERISTSK